MAKQRYSADELEGIAKTAMQNALGSISSDVGQARERNLRYYNAEAKGDLAPTEIEDRSDFVATDVADTVEGMLPELLDMFISGDAVDIEARKFGDEDNAKKVKAWLNHLFMNKMDGVEITHDWFKDSLIQKNGFVKVWAEEESTDSKQRYEGQTEEALVMLMQDGWELVGQPEQDEKGLSFVVNKESKTKRIRAIVPPPNEMRVDSNSRWDADPAMIGQCFYKRRFELEQDGIVCEDLAASYNDSSETLEQLGELMNSRSDSPDKSHDLIKVEDVYIKLDQDKDGIAEWVHITLVDEKLAVYEDGSDAWEQVDDHPYVWICPIPRPHAFFGDCPADFAIQPQKLRTHHVRNIEDNTRLAINARTYINMDAEVDVGDVLESRPGGAIRGRGPMSEAIGTIGQPFLGAPAYQFNEFIDTWKAERTGYTKYSAGMDSNSLNRTATGVSIVTQRSQLRMKLMARFFAVGYAKLMKKMLKLSITYMNQPEWLKLNNEFIQINPSHFTTDYGFKINVGLGTGTKEQQAGRVMGLMQVMQAGAQMGVVKPENMAEVIKLYADINEFKQPERFVSAPEPQQGPNPEQIQQGMEQLQQQGQQIQEMGGELQRLEQENAQLKQANANKEGDLQIKAQGGQIDAQFKAQELALKERELALKEQEAMFKAQLEQYNAETQRLSAMNSPESAQDGSEARESEKGDQSTAALIAGFQAMLQPKTSVGSLTRMPDGSYQMVKQENINPQGL
jgi:hypothetical protein